MSPFFPHCCSSLPCPLPSPTFSPPHIPIVFVHGSFIHVLCLEFLNQQRSLFISNSCPCTLPLKLDLITFFCPLMAGHTHPLPSECLWNISSGTLKWHDFISLITKAQWNILNKTHSCHLRVINILQKIISCNMQKSLCWKALPVL